MKTMDISETIAVSDLKVGRSRHLRVRVITGSDRIGGNYRIGPNFPLIYEFYVTFLEYLRPNKLSNHIGSLVGDQCRAYLSLK